MTKLQRTADILKFTKASGRPPTLPELVLTVRSSINGASDVIQCVELDRILEAFRYRLEVWDDSDDKIDIAVKQMVLAGIELIEKELKYRVEIGWSY